MTQSYRSELQAQVKHSQDAILTSRAAIADRVESGQERRQLHDNEALLRRLKHLLVQSRRWQYATEIES